MIADGRRFRVTINLVVKQSGILIKQTLCTVAYLFTTSYMQNDAIVIWKFANEKPAVIKRSQYDELINKNWKAIFTTE